jgi:RimJ/RimL family protein N-acetyltransferase
VAVIRAVAEERRFILTEPHAVDPNRVRSVLEGDGEDALWVLEDDESVVGIAGLHQTRAPGVMSLGMAIVTRARGRGGGRMLLEAVLDHARAAALRKVELEVFTDNAPAIGLYARHGFEVEGLRRRHHRRADGSVRDALLMARLLSRGPPRSAIDVMRGWGLPSRGG